MHKIFELDYLPINQLQGGKYEVDYTKSYRIWDNWKNVEGLILNSCYNLPANVPVSGDRSTSINGLLPDLKSFNEESFGLQWFFATKGAVILGWGTINVSDANGNTVYGDGIGKSPSDIQVNGINLTDNIMKAFWAKINGSATYTGSEIAKLWVESVLVNKADAKTESWQNAVGIGFSSDRKIEIWAITSSLTVKKVWSFLPDFTIPNK